MDEHRPPDPNWGRLLFLAVALVIVFVLLTWT